MPGRPYAEPPWLVVRGGLLLLPDLLKTVPTCVAKFGRPGFSVFAAPAHVTPTQLVDAASRRLPHPQMSFGRVGTLLERGFTLEPTLTEPHHTVFIPEGGLDEDDLQFWCRQFRSSFGAAVAREALGVLEVDPFEG